MRSFSVALLVLLAASVGGAALAQLAQTHAGGKAGGAAPSVCDGTIDASQGCPLPMLGL